MQATRTVNTTALISKARQLWPPPGSEVNAYGDSITTGAARAFEEEKTMKVPDPDTLTPSAVRPDTLTPSTVLFIFTHLPLPLYYPETLTPSAVRP